MEEGKGRGKTRRYGPAALSFGRSWTVEATEEIDEARAAHERYFR